jgi:hypothetical protein
LNGRQQRIQDQEALDLSTISSSSSSSSSDLGSEDDSVDDELDEYDALVAEA